MHWPAGQEKFRRNVKMANKVRDYHKLAADIKDTIGAGNIMTATHCATRLRLVLKETPDDSVTKKSNRCLASSRW